MVIVNRQSEVEIQYRSCPPTFLSPGYTTVMANQYTKEWPKRFWDKVRKTDECWNWVGCLNDDGYGSIRYENKARKAHRISYLLEYGAFDERLRVLHSCDNPTCVRPDHLFLGTQGDNMRDMVLKGRHGAGSSNPPTFEEYNKTKRNKRDVCRRGHPFSKENTRIKRIKNRWARLCRTCETNTAKRDIVQYKVNGFVRGVENRKQVVQEIVDKIKSNGVRCWYCDGPFECLDHYIPKKAGGPISTENINPSCNDCNQERKSLKK